MKKILHTKSHFADFPGLDVQSDLDEFRYSAWHVFPVRLQHWSTQPTSGGNFGFVVCRSGVQLTLLYFHKVLPD